MDTPSLPSLSEMDDTNTQVVPKAFVETEVKSSLSFIKKIMSNAKLILSQRCNSLHPSIKSEEPTRETDDGDEYTEYSKVFTEIIDQRLINRVKYAASDYCMVDDDSKMDNTEITMDITDTSTKEISCSGGGFILKGSTGNTSENSGDVYNDTSDKDTLCSRTTSENKNVSSNFSYGFTQSSDDTNGSCQPSEFILEFDNNCTSNEITVEHKSKPNPTPLAFESTTAKTEKSGQASKNSSSLLNGWINPFNNEKIEVKKNDFNIPCRDECSNQEASTVRNIVKSSTSKQSESNILSFIEEGKKEEIGDEKKLPRLLSIPQNTKEVTCHSCGLTSSPPSSPSHSYSSSLVKNNWHIRVETVQTGENEIYPKRVHCNDESNTSPEENLKFPDDIEQLNISKLINHNESSIKKMRNAPPEKTSPNRRASHRTNSSIDRKKTVEKIAGKRKSDHKLDSSPVAKRVRSTINSRDQNNQCAFIGSPVLENENFIAPSTTSTITVERKTSEKLGSMLSDVSSREKSYRSQIQEFKNREKHYKSMFDCLDGEIAKCNNSPHDDHSEIGRITKELKNENKILKSEVMEMRLDLKHTLETVQGPMRLKLEAEKSRCEQLQHQLKNASRSMAMSEENYMKEMNNLKMQLCLASANMNELESINKKLKDQMNLTETLCAKLEDDLIQQKLNEAETIKRLTNRKIFEEPRESVSVVKCESNLHDIARKLSKTIKDCSPVGVPLELKGAAKLIRDLTDMVESRKDAVLIESLPGISRTNISCQSSPHTEENSTQCKDSRTIGTVVSGSLISGANQHKPINTLYACTPDLINMKSFTTNQKSAARKQDTSHQKTTFGSYKHYKSDKNTASERTATKFHNNMQDNCTDPKMIDKKISSGQVYVDEYKNKPPAEIPEQPQVKSQPKILFKIDKVSLQAAIDELRKDADNSRSQNAAETEIEAAKLEITEIKEAKIKDLDDEIVASNPEYNLQLTSSRSELSNKIGENYKSVKFDIKEMVEDECFKPDDEIVTSNTELNLQLISSRPESSDQITTTIAENYKSGGVEFDIEESVEDESFKPQIIDIDLDTVDETNISHSNIKVLNTFDLSYKEPANGPWLDERSGDVLHEHMSNAELPFSRTSLTTIEQNDSDVDEEPTSKKRHLPPTTVTSKPTESKAKTPYKSTKKSMKLRMKPSLKSQKIVTNDMDFPFEVKTEVVDVTDEPPERLNVTTCFTDSGNLEVITEGPKGTIETFLNYKEDGTIEVITQMIETTGTSSTVTSTKKILIPNTTTLPTSDDSSLLSTTSKSVNWDNLKVKDETPLLHPPIISVYAKEDTKDATKNYKSSKSGSVSEVSVRSSKKKNVRLVLPLLVNTSKCCLGCCSLNKTSSMEHLQHLSAATSNSSIYTDEACETVPIPVHDAVCSNTTICGLQQTAHLEVVQKSSGYENAKINSSTLTVPIITSSCTNGTCTEKPITNDATTDSLNIKKDESVMCKNEICSGSSLCRFVNNPVGDLNLDLNCPCLDVGTCATKSEQLGDITGTTENCTTSDRREDDITAIQYLKPYVSKKHKQTQNYLGYSLSDFDDIYMDLLNLDCSTNEQNKLENTKLPMGHALDCECVDCHRMLRRLTELAQNTEFCMVNDTKQVYQVTSDKCQCPNAQKVSKIPVSTKSAKPTSKLPTCTCTGICTCRPCSDPTGGKIVMKQETKIVKKMGPDELAQLCDCGKCDCLICAKAKSSKKACCCTPECVCDVCKIEKMKKELGKLKHEVNELKGTSTPPNLGYPDGCDCDICNCPLPPGEDPRRELPDDCDCFICECPLAPGKGGDTSGCNCIDCDCPKGPKYQKPKVKKPMDLSGCTCNPCKCPGGPLSVFPVCDCKVCECNPCSDPRKKAAIQCDCEPCECNPCGDTKKNMIKWSPKPCICEECKCSGASDSDCICITCICGQHPPDCTCDKCVCGRNMAADCKCPVCACGTKAGKSACECEQCKCGGPGKPKPISKEDAAAEKKLKAFLKRSCSTHALDCKCAGCQCSARSAGGALMCTCIPCKCVECIFEKQRVASPPADCKCELCECNECAGISVNCKCTDCKCMPCAHKLPIVKKKRKADCKCGAVCNCKSCVPSEVKKEVKETKSAPALPKGRSCHCIECYCDKCSNEKKKGSNKRPEVAIKVSRKKSVSTGPSKTDCKKPPPPAKTDGCKCGDTCLCKECEHKKGSGPPGCKCASCACKPCDPSPAKKSTVGCKCTTCTCKECTSGGFQAPKRMECKCQTCTCETCEKKDDGGGKDSGGFQVPKRIPCECDTCTCATCEKKGGAGGGGGKGVCPPGCPGSTKGGGKGTSKAPSKTGGFEVPKSIPCQCQTCACVICNKDEKKGDNKGLQLRGGSAITDSFIKDVVPPYLEIPDRLPCRCNPCKCVMCNKQRSDIDTAAEIQRKESSMTCITCLHSLTRCDASQTSAGIVSKDQDGQDYDCAHCLYTNKDSNTDTKVDAGVGKVLSIRNVQVGESSNKISRSTKNAKVGESENRFGTCDSIELNCTNLAGMDNATLTKNIAYNTKENFYCKNQIQEITSALSNIKGVCSEVEEKAMRRPWIKQASAFGQTMSGLKLALNNLQEKCRAKDLLIEAMTGELRNRTTSSTFLQVLDTCISNEVPDYDKTVDIIPKKSIAMAAEKVARKRKGTTRTCKCGKHHKDKDYKKVDMTGFEVVDIRRITNDSIIIKWNPPKSGAITGYDIFINGVNKSKVMSGGRTSAMVHCVDLRATIQITIYAVTKCGRCEPPAIAIYEIRT